MEKGGSKADSLDTLLILLSTLNDITGDDLRVGDGGNLDLIVLSFHGDRDIDF